MTTLIGDTREVGEDNSLNVTIRRTSKASNTKMAGLSIYDLGIGIGAEEDSLFVDSILSQTETEEVEKMLQLEGMITDDYGSSDQVTSTQMTREGKWNTSMMLSPILQPSPMALKGFPIPINNRFSVLANEEEEGNQINSKKNLEGVRDRNGFNNEVDSREDTVNAAQIIDSPSGPSREAKDGEVRDAQFLGSNVVNAAAPEPPEETVGGSQAGSLDNQRNDGGDVIKPDPGQGGDVNKDDSSGKEESGSEDGEENNEPDMDLRSMNTKLRELNHKSGSMEKSLSGLKVSLEFSQKEIDDLKKENTRLREKVANNELEGERTQFQVNRVDEKVDRLDTTGKKKNLSIEGLPEVREGRENVEKSIWDLLDQLNIGRGLELDTCYRVGPYNKNHTRPILVSFLKQADRDLVYSKRMELRNTANFKNTWINEDLGAASKRKRNLIRLIARQAKIQGIDHRTGKYAIHVDNVKFEDGNLDELPPSLHPTSIKQVQIDKETIAYQSEKAPFSNFYPATIVMGNYRLNSAEQAYQFVRAKTLNRPLIAMKIYLSRSAYDIKQWAEELGTSDVWEAKKAEVMYVCMKKKFDQNPDLRQILLKSGNCELVEATPNREWGCGATLSSNVLRRHTWPEENKQGKILMTITEEIRVRAQGK